MIIVIVAMLLILFSVGTLIGVTWAFFHGLKQKRIDHAELTMYRAARKAVAEENAIAEMREISKRA